MGTADDTPQHGPQGRSQFSWLSFSHSGGPTRIQAIEGIKNQGRAWPRGPQVAA